MKSKKTIFVFLLLISQFCAKAQNWQSVGSPLDWQVRYLYNDSINHKLIASSAVSNYMRFLQYSDTTDWDTLGGYIGGAPFQITNFRGNLLGVNYHTSTNYSGVGILVNNSWQLFTQSQSPCYAFFQTDSNLFVLGSYDSIAGIRASSFAKYDGQNWNSMNVGFGGGSGTACATIFQGNLFVGGGFHDTIGNCLAWYDGTNWHGFGNYFSGGFDAINCMAVYNGFLYVGGYFTTASGSPGNFIARWDGANWTQVGGGIGGGQVLTMKVYNNELWVGGQFTTAGGISTPYLAKYDGNDWCNVGNFDNGVISIENYNNELYIGGGFWTIDGDSIAYIAKWIGGNNTNQCGHLNTGIEQVEIIYSVNVFPNPATTSATFQIAGFIEEYEVLILDQLGREIYRRKNNTETLEISTRDFAPGLYYYNVTESGKICATGKLLIE